MHEINYCVYKHTSPSNKVYIGITCQKPERRWENGKGYIKNKYFYRAIEKYGWENIKHEILFNGLTKEEACQKEIELINLFKSNQKEYGYNLSSGGEGGSKGCHWTMNFTEEHRLKLSKAAEGNKKFLGKHHTEETKKKQSEAHSGKSKSEEHKRKLSEANKGKKQSDEHIRKRVEKLKGKKRTDEQRRNMSESRKGKFKGREPWNKGKTGVQPCSEENKRKLSETQKLIQSEKSKAYKEYKENGGTLKWNDFQKLYNQPK